jgi:isocitrate lyase
MSGIRIIHVMPESQPFNNYIYATLKSDMEHGRFTMPDTNNASLLESDLSPKEMEIISNIIKTKIEMLAIQAQETAQGFRFITEGTVKKDRITALVLCNYLVNEQRKAFVPEQEEEIGEGFWVAMPGGVT